MIYKKIYLKDYFSNIKSNASITSYCISNHSEYPYDVKRKTILVIPGGGYEFVSFREAEPIALRFLAENFNVFVLDYSVMDFKYPYPLVEAYAAICYIRRNSESYNVDSNHLGVMGFSAGGHLAASISNYQKEKYYADFLNANINELRIDFTILSYPVISMDEKISHLSTRTHISQNNKELLDYFSIEKHINDYFPRTFIWTTIEDELVPYIHSKLMKEALDKKGIPNRLFIYEKGPHGLSTCDELSCDEKTISSIKDTGDWIKEASRWIKGK